MSLPDRLREAEPPDAGGAEARARRVLLDAAAPVAPRRRGRRRMLPSALAVAAAAAVAITFAATGRPGDAVADWVRRALVAPAPRPAAPAGLLGPGRVLVSGDRATALIGTDGRVRRLGPFPVAAWSPRGRFVAGVAHESVRAVDLRGRLRWTVRAAGAVRSVAWSPDGFRVAYYSDGAGVRVVAGDGTGDHPYGPLATSPLIAWRPGSPHTLTTIDRHHRVDVRDVDTARLVTRTATGLGRGARGLAWSPDGRRLAIERRGALVVLDVPRGRIQRIALPRGERLAGIAWSPRAPVLAAVVRAADGRSSRLLLVAGARIRRSGSHSLAADARLRWPVQLRGVTWSPDGRRLVAGWPATRQWVVVPAAGDGAPAVRRAPRVVGAAPRAVGWAPR